MDIKQTQKAIEVMQAYVDGKQIQSNHSRTWKDVMSPTWNLNSCDYRVKTQKKGANDSTVIKMS